MKKTNLAATLGSIRSQTVFKRVALLGGIEKTLKDMKEVETKVMDTNSKQVYYIIQGWMYIQTKDTHEM